MVRRSSVPDGVAEAVVAVAAVSPRRCTGTRPLPDGDDGDGTMTDDGDGGVPRSAKTTRNSHRCRFPHPGDGAPISGVLAGGVVGARVVVVGVGAVGACRKSLTCGCFAGLPDDCLHTLRHRRTRKNVLY